MAAKIVLSERKLELEKMLLSGEPLPKIAQKLGVSISTLHRYLRARRSRMLANFHCKQAIVFDTLLRKSIEDHEKLGRLIDQEEKFSLDVRITRAVGCRDRIGQPWGKRGLITLALSRRYAPARDG
jgi:DNA-binding CsgD family transcriptional regulator